MSEFRWLACLMVFLVAALTPSAGAACPACPAREVREAGDWVITREEPDADGELYLTQMEAKFERLAYHLRHLTLASSNGHKQTIPTTNEHRTNDPATGLWIKAVEFEVGQHLSELPGKPPITPPARALRKHSQKSNFLSVSYGDIAAGNLRGA